MKSYIKVTQGGKVQHYGRSFRAWCSDDAGTDAALAQHTLAHSAAVRRMLPPKVLRRNSYSMPFMKAGLMQQQGRTPPGMRMWFMGAMPEEL